MRTRNEDDYRQKKAEIMEKCYECYAENGFTGTGIKQLAKACGCTSANFYIYFDNLDDLIIQSTAHCMSRVEDDFMAKAPTGVPELWKFIDEIPYWTAEHHGKKYRLMYQIYTHPKYREYGRQFFAGVDQRYTEYAKQLEGKIGIPHQTLTPLIFILIRACVHYALFEDDFYLKAQIQVLKESLVLFIEKYRAEAAAAGAST